MCKKEEYHRKNEEKARIERRNDKNMRRCLMDIE